MKSVIFWLWLSLPACAQTIYQYAGELITTADPPYTLADQIVGFVECSPQLPPFASDLDAICYITDFNFSDGVQVRNPSNSTICTFEVSTDGEGHIVSWNVFIRESNVAPGATQFTLDFNSTGGDSVGSGAADVEICGGISLSVHAYNTIPGIWTATLPVGSPITYSFSGDPFTSIEPPYVLGGELTGSFQVSNPLPPGMPLAELGDAITSFSFDDGIAMRTNLNSEICKFELSTGMAGHIKSWDIQVREIPATIGLPQHSISTSHTGDYAGSANAGSFACEDHPLSPFGRVLTPGSWTDTLPAGTTTDYFFEGAPFTSAQAPYSIGLNVSGFARFADPLLPFLSDAELKDCLLDFQFDDTLQVRTPADSEVCGFRVSTDLNGHVTRWSATFRASNFVMGQPQHTIQVNSEGDTAGTVTAGSEACASSFFDVSGFSAVAGTWTDPMPPSTPAVYSYSGEFYAAASMPFSRRYRLRGRISLSSPLAPNMNLSNLYTNINGFEFHDGLEKLTYLNSVPCAMSFTTNGDGDIVNWDVQLLQNAAPEHLIRIQNKGLKVGDFSGALLSGTCDDGQFDYTATTPLPGTWIRMCPELLASLEDWPLPSDILSLLSLNCGW